MANQIIPLGNIAIFRAQGMDDGGTVRGIQNGTAKINNYPLAYVAVDSSGSLFVVVRGSVPDGQVETLNITINGKDLAGTALPELVVSFDVPGVPAPPLATRLVITQGPLVRDQIGYRPPDDPGGDTVSF